jgi:hypothetical protein
MSTYLLILRRNQDEPLTVPFEEMFVRFKRFTESLNDKGVLRGVERLKPSAEGTTSRERDGVMIIEGPYRSQEAIIGFYLLEVTDRDAAHAIAKQCPILPVGGSVEIRETEFQGRAARIDTRREGEV